MAVKLTVKITVKVFCLIVFSFISFQVFPESLGVSKTENSSKVQESLNQSVAPAKESVTEGFSKGTPATEDINSSSLINEKEKTTTKKISQSSIEKSQKPNQDSLIKTSANESQNPNQQEIVKASANKTSNQNLKPQQKKEEVIDSSPLHSFRPLLIQGGKKIKRDSKNIKVDINSISETEVFFIETDFKKRIYLDEGEL